MWNAVFPYFDGGGADEVVRWMPAHKGTEEAEQLRDSRGNPLSEADVRVNALVHELAKASVEEHRVPKHMRHEAARRAARVKRVVLGICLVARAASQ